MSSRWWPSPFSSWEKQVGCEGAALHTRVTQALAHRGGWMKGTSLCADISRKARSHGGSVLSSPMADSVQGPSPPQAHSTN